MEDEDKHSSHHAPHSNKKEHTGGGSFLSHPFFKRIECHQILISSAFCSFLLALFSSLRDSYSYGFLNLFLGYFFVFSAMIKIAHLVHFVGRFTQRSLFSNWWSPYSYIFPFLQLAFGISLINSAFVFMTSLFMFVLMGELVLASALTMMSDDKKDFSLQTLFNEEEASDDMRFLHCESFLSLPVILVESVFALLMSMINIFSIIRQW